MAIHPPPAGLPACIWGVRWQDYTAWIRITTTKRSIIFHFISRMVAAYQQPPRCGCNGTLWERKGTRTSIHQRHADYSSWSRVQSGITYQRSLRNVQTKEVDLWKDCSRQDQLIPGLGNSIAQDIMFKAKLPPKRPIASLSKAQIKISIKPLWKL